MITLILPYDGNSWLFTLKDSDGIQELAPLARISNEAFPEYVFNSDKSLLGVMEQEGKRFALYRILTNEPWIETVLKPHILTRRCIGISLHIYGNALYIGGKDFIWKRSEDAPDSYVPLHVPEVNSHVKVCIAGAVFQGNALYSVYKAEERSMAFGTRHLLDISDTTNPQFRETDQYISIAPDCTVKKIAQMGQDFAMLLQSQCCVTGNVISSFFLKDLTTRKTLMSVSEEIRLSAFIGGNPDCENAFLFSVQRMIGYKGNWYFACGNKGLVKLERNTNTIEHTCIVTRIPVDGMEQVLDFCISNEASDYGFAAGFDSTGEIVLRRISL
jgi:hypothetical protein